MKWLAILAVLSLSVACTTHSSPQGKMNGEMGGKGMMMKGGMMKMMTPEMHQNMAKMHQEMAKCLKSKKSKDQCQKIMMEHKAKMCPKMKDGKMCPMMAKMKGMKEADTSNKKSDSENHEAHH